MVDRSIFNEKVNAKPFIEKYRLKKNTKKVLYVGRLQKDKRVKILIKAAKFVLKKIPEAKFIIVGGGEESENLKRMAKDLGIGKSVIFTGFISDKLLPSVYAA